MTNVKKVGSVFFTILNTVLIISLLLFSTILILSVNSNSPAILGFSSKLIFDRTDESAMLVVSQSSSKLAANDEFVFVSGNGIGLYIADSVDATSVTYRGVDNSITATLLFSSPEYGGKVLIKNAPIGEILSTLVKTESMSVIYVLIIGTFSLLLLLLFLVHYLLKNKDKLVEYYEEVEEDLVDENGLPIVAQGVATTSVNSSKQIQPGFDEIPEIATMPSMENAMETPMENPAETATQPQTMADSFAEMPEVKTAKSKKSKNKKKKEKNQKSSEVFDLIDGIEKSPSNTPMDNLAQRPSPASGRRQATSKSKAMPTSRISDDATIFEFEINEDTSSSEANAFFNNTNMYSEDDILAVLTEPNATFVIEDEEDDDYYEEGNVKYFNNGIDKPSLQETLVAYVHTNSDVDPEPPLPVAKTSEGIPIEWFESILEVAENDPRLPEVLLEDFEIKPVQIEKPAMTANDILSRVEEMQPFKRVHPEGGFQIVEPVEQPKTKFNKPSADSLLQEIDSIVQKPEEPAIVENIYTDYDNDNTDEYETQDYTNYDDDMLNTENIEDDEFQSTRPVLSNQLEKVEKTDSIEDEIHEELQKQYG